MMIFIFLIGLVFVCGLLMAIISRWVVRVPLALIISLSVALLLIGNDRARYVSTDSTELQLINGVGVTRVRRFAYWDQSLRGFFSRGNGVQAKLNRLRAPADLTFRPIHGADFRLGENEVYRERGELLRHSRLSLNRWKVQIASVDGDSFETFVLSTLTDQSVAGLDKNSDFVSFYGAQPDGRSMTIIFDLPRSEFYADIATKNGPLVIKHSEGGLYNIIRATSSAAHPNGDGASKNTGLCSLSGHLIDSIGRAEITRPLLEDLETSSKEITFDILVVRSPTAGRYQPADFKASKLFLESVIGNYNFASPRAAIQFRISPVFDWSDITRRPHNADDEVELWRLAHEAYYSSRYPAKAQQNLYSESATYAALNEARDAVGAQLVVLIASIIPTVDNNGRDAGIASARGFSAGASFAIVQDWAPPSTLSHEVAHLLGAEHEIVESEDQRFNSAWSHGIYEYGTVASILAEARLPVLSGSSGPCFGPTPLVYNNLGSRTFANNLTAVQRTIVDFRDTVEVQKRSRRILDICDTLPRVNDCVSKSGWSYSFGPGEESLSTEMDADIRRRLATMLDAKSRRKWPSEFVVVGYADRTLGNRSNFEYAQNRAKNTADLISRAITKYDPDVYICSMADTRRECTNAELNSVASAEERRVDVFCYRNRRKVDCPTAPALAQAATSLQ